MFDAEGLSLPQDKVDNAFAAQERMYKVGLATGYEVIYVEGSLSAGGGGRG